MSMPKVCSASRLLWLPPLAATGIVVFYFLQPCRPIDSKMFMGGMCGLAWWVVLSITNKISMDGNGLVVFESVVKTTEVRVEDITSIERSGKTTRIRHRNGEVQVPNWSIHKLEEFLEDIKRANPSIVDDVDPLAKFAQSPIKVLALVPALIAVAAGIAALATNVPEIVRLFR